MAVSRALLGAVRRTPSGILMDEAENERRESLPVLWTNAAAEAGEAWW
jgi:hypothetical protein